MSAMMTVDATTPVDPGEWRTVQRAELLARRMSVPPERLSAWNETITMHLREGFPLLREMMVGFCWPYKGEFDARFLIGFLRMRGARSALPAVLAKGAPLEFREWWPGARLSRGVLDLPVPTATAVVLPDAVLIPLVGFCEHGGRPGYGGGYFGRTLAMFATPPLKIGVAFELSRIPTIYPQPHDVLMDFIVTEAGIHAVGDSGLRRIDASACAHLAEQIAACRGLPGCDAT
jgi:5,10-methenyltetrahydrofolate synthetase